MCLRAFVQSSPLVASFVRYFMDSCISQHTDDLYHCGICQYCYSYTFGWSLWMSAFLSFLCNGEAGGMVKTSEQIQDICWISEGQTHATFQEQLDKRHVRHVVVLSPQKVRSCGDCVCWPNLCYDAFLCSIQYGNLYACHFFFVLKINYFSPRILMVELDHMSFK